MKQTKTMCHLAVLAILGGPPTAAMATDGYFPHGFGIKAKGMGGTAVARTDDAFAGINNPAASAFAGNRLEGGLDVFSPKRGMNRTGSGPLDANVSSQSNIFYIPELGFNKAINDKIGVGVTVYGNGGMNTDYPGGQIPAGVCGPAPANVLCGGGGLGVDLQQLIVAPTIAYKVDERHSLGVSPLLVYQQFQVNGLQAFDNAPGFPPFTSNPGKVTNNGNDRSTGLGIRLGYMGKLTDDFTFGASYSPKTKMSKFDKYAGLFAGGGSFDIPENYALGLAFQATPGITLALDYQRINYSGVPSIGNASNVQAPLGAANGPGFGWSDINVWKIGAQWQATPQLALRAGFNKSDNPIQSRDVTFNIIAPGVTTTHFTLGGTYALSSSTEVSVAYMHAPRKSVSGSSLFNAVIPGLTASETIRMSQNSLGVQFAWRF